VEVNDGRRAAASALTHDIVYVQLGFTVSSVPQSFLREELSNDVGE